jgi:hypothetical protein
MGTAVSTLMNSRIGAHTREVDWPSRVFVDAELCCEGMTLLTDMVLRWRKFGSQRKAMFFVNGDERLSHEMEQRAVLEAPDTANSTGRSRAAMRRCVLSVRFESSLSYYKATHGALASLTHGGS